MFDIEECVNFLISADRMIRFLNNEDAYSEWIKLVLDGSRYDDFREMAMDRDFLSDVSVLFTSLIKRYGSSGFFVGGILI